MKGSLSLLIGAITLAACGCAAPARATTPRVTCTIELDHALLAAESVQRTVMKVALRAPELTSSAERPPVNLAVVLDRSGSMGGDKIERAKEAAIEALHRLGPKDLFSLVIYDHEVETVVPPQSASNVEWIEGRIRKIQSRGNTALFAGVSQGAAEIRKHIENRKYVPRILLLSDGQANVGPSATDDLGRLGTALMKEGVAVTTVGVGTDYNEDLMTRLSQNSDGNAYFAAKSSELSRIFNAELGGVLKVVARQVVLEIVCAEGVKPLRIIGREGRIRGGTVEITLNQLYGGQEKFALIEVEVPAARMDEERKIAAASCRYADAITQDEGKASTHATVRFSRDEKAVAASFNAAVQKDIAINSAAIASGYAISLNDAGKNALAAVHLKKESDRLRKVAKDYNLPEVEEQAAELSAKSEVLSSRALNADERKNMRTDNYHTANQQMAK